MGHAEAQVVPPLAAGSDHLAAALAACVVGQGPDVAPGIGPR